jgi:predicted O-methyltransferase YrrM
MPLLVATGLFLLLAGPHARPAITPQSTAAGADSRQGTSDRPIHGGVAASSSVPAPPTPPIPPDLIKLLHRIKAADKEQLAVSEEDGRFLRVMVAAAKARRALEIGAASGYSAIWIGLGLRQTGGTLTAIEYDPARAKAAAENVRRAGLSDIVTIVAGDAFREVPKLPGGFDFVFLDAWKRDYRRFFDMVFPRLNAGGLFLGHNVVNKKDEMGDFLAAIHDNPAVITTIVSPSGEGMSVSVKLR